MAADYNYSYERTRTRTPGSSYSGGILPNDYINRSGGTGWGSQGNSSAMYGGRLLAGDTMDPETERFYLARYLIGEAPKEADFERQLRLLDAQARIAAQQGDAQREHELTIQRMQLEKMMEQMRLQFGFQGDMARFNAETGIEGNYTGARNEMLSRASAAATEADQQRARSRYDASNALYNQMMQTGGISAEEEAQRLAAENQRINDETVANQGNMNAALANNGQSANPMAAAALGMAGRFAGARARGDAKAGIASERIRNRFQGAQGSAGIAGALSQIDMTPTRESIMYSRDQIEKARLPQAPSAGNTTFSYSSGSSVGGGNSGSGGGSWYSGGRGRVRSRAY